MIHVWNIYLHLGHFRGNVGKYSIHGASGIYSMDPKMEVSYHINKAYMF